MNKKSFADKIRDETLAEIVDITLDFEKTAKNRSIKKSLLKIIPAAAVIALVIGLINFLPFINNIINNINDNTCDNKTKINPLAEVINEYILKICNFNDDIPRNENKKSNDTNEIEWWTYEEYKMWTDEQKVELQRGSGTKYPQEEIDLIFESYDYFLEMIKNGMQMSKRIYNNYFSYILSTDNILVTFSDMSSYTYTIAVIALAVDDEEIPSMAFGANSLDDLNKMVEGYLDEQVESGKITREKAGNVLFEVSKLSEVSIIDEILNQHNNK